MEKNGLRNLFAKTKLGYGFRGRHFAVLIVFAECSKHKFVSVSCWRRY